MIFGPNQLIMINVFHLFEMAHVHVTSKYPSSLNRS